MSGKPTFALFKQPWRPTICDEAVAFMDEISEGADVLELGSGASTPYFVVRAKSVLSIEHDEDWANVAKNSCAKLDGQFELRLVGKDAIARTVRYLRNDSFDVVYVDCYQYERREAAERAMNKVRVGGYLVIDDTHFPQLADIPELLAAWEVTEFHGKKLHPLRGNVVDSNVAFYKRCS